MQNKEFDKLVESFLTPKTKLEENNAFSLASLLSLVEEIQRVKTINEQEEKIATVGGVLLTSKTKSFEKENPSVEQFYQLFQDVLLKGNQLTGTPEEKIQKLIDIVTKLKAEDNTNKSLSEAFSIILFVASLNNMIWNIAPDEASAAGNYFEKFISFLIGGTFNAEEKTIYDIIGPNGEAVSLKLVKSFKVSGSITNMFKFFGVDPLDPNSKPNEKQITYIIAIKKAVSVLYFYSYTFNFNQFFEALTKANKYEKFVEKLKVDKEINSLIRQVALSKTRTTPDEAIKLIDVQNTELEKQLKQIQINVNFAEESGQEADSLIDQKNQIENDIKKNLILRDKISKLNITKKLLSAESVLQFEFTRSELDAMTPLKSLKGEILGMTVEQEKEIIRINKSIFDENIKSLIEESKLVQFKVNNFLLSDEKDRKVSAEDALNSVNSLKDNLQKYT